MRCVIQRVTEAKVTVNGETVGEIGQGLMVLVGVSVDDTEADVRYIAEKLPNMRIFEDDQGRMNRSALDVGASVLAVSQFTLYGDTRGQRRPGFTRAARPEQAEALYTDLVGRLRGAGLKVETGRFRTEMLVSLVNDGPCTILMDSEKSI